MRKQIGILALMAVFLLSTAYALTCTYDQASTTAGTSTGYIRGASQNISITISDYATNQNTTAGILSTSGTGCTTTGALVYNGTVNVSYMNFTVDTTAMRDDTSCQFAVILKNLSETSITCTNSGGLYISDNTQPVCTHSQSSRETYNPKQTWVVTGTYASSATIKFGSNAAFAMTEASDVFSYTGRIPESTYNVVATTSDGLNSTACTLEYVRIDARSTIKQVGIAVASGAVKKTGATGGNNTAILVILGVIAVWYWKRNN